MHDPDFVLFDVRLLRLDVWHREPDGHDSGTICGNPPRPVAARLLWAVRHARHLWFRWWPTFRVRRWITDRCDHCGHRFRWREARYGYQSTDRAWHGPCMSLQQTQSHLDDLTAHVLGTADWNTNWRAKYRLDNLGRTGETSERGVRHV